ncbi:hypothetical protein [Roseibium aestuarii]|uniref:Probable chemoreceptor glutamine deamidase CheD n=1 Tax=Roseibium aestuarii TaxID=2600299 RepID=A0ABW4JYL1_9HYPH|nr:hypothetical protein [Roseibium aestuarii]
MLMPVPDGLTGPADDTASFRLEQVDISRRVRVLPGESRSVLRPDLVLMTVLGSCVSACIRDPRTGFGGMNHFMLPFSETGTWNGEEAAMRYGNYAMEALINEVLKSGCRREDLEIKAFGGADLGFHQSGVGRKNVAFLIGYLNSEGLRLAAHDFGGNQGRRVFYRPATGQVRQNYIRTTPKDAVLREEQKYARTLETRPLDGTIELF